MKSSKSDAGIYKIRYIGTSFQKNETVKYFNFTVIDDGKYDIAVIRVRFAPFWSMYPCLSLKLITDPWFD